MRTSASHASTGTVLAAIVIAAAVFLGLHSNASEVTCGDFTDASDSDQRSTIRSLLEENGNGNPPARLVAITQGAVRGYCIPEHRGHRLDDAYSDFQNLLRTIGSTPDDPVTPSEPRGTN